jgi:outer membrane murein-binding lipoprotein Lpp
MLIGATGSSGLLLLAVLACPVGMGLMMLFMGRGMMAGMKQNDRDQSDTDASSLAEMKAEQARLAEKIEALEGQHAAPQATEHAADREADRVS